MRFIHGLYQRLISPSSANQKSGDRKVKVQTYEKFKWDDLSEMVLEQTVTLMAQVNQLKEQVGFWKTAFVGVFCYLLSCFTQL